MNGARISYSNAGKWGGRFNEEFSNMRGISACLRLKMGDRVNLDKNGAALADANEYHSTYFTGSLLEEDIDLA